VELENLLQSSKKKKRSLQLDVKRKVAAYIRVSTEEQAVNPEGSIKNQEERIKQALVFKNANQTFGDLTQVFIDRGRSGKDMNRQELQKLFRMIRSGEVNLLMVTDLSRLSRSIRDFSQIWEFMQTHGCELWSLRENFDTSTAAGEMMLYSIANFAQFERKQTAERVAANFESRASRGLYNGGMLPLGYEIDPDNNGGLKINESEARVVVAAFEALLREGSIAAAAKWLNANGFENRSPLRGGGSCPRHGRFTVGNLHSIFNNKKYIGVRVYKGRDGKVNETKGNWLPILDTITFRMAEKILKTSKKRKLHNEKRYPFLFSGKVKCLQCGFNMNGKSAHGNGGKFSYYEHGWQTKKEGCLPMSERKKKCHPFRVPAKVLEKRAWEEVEKLLRTPQLSKVIFEKLGERLKIQKQDPRIENAEANLHALETRSRVLIQRLSELPSSVSAAPIYKELERIEDEKKKLDTGLLEARKKHQAPAISPMGYEKFLERLAKVALSSNGSETKRKIMDCLVERIEITPDGFNLCYYVDEDQIEKGEAIASPLNSMGKKFLSPGYFSLQNGGR